MPAPLADLAPRFAFNAAFLKQLTADFDADGWQRIGGEGGSPAHWIVGHLAVARRGLLRKLGGETPEKPWEASFGRGSDAQNVSSDAPDPEALVADIESSGNGIAERLGALTPNEAAADFGRKFPDGSTTIAGSAHFLYFHETYHLGQLGLIRRQAGKSGFA